MSDRSAPFFDLGEAQSLTRKLVSGRPARARYRRATASGVDTSPQEGYLAWTGEQAARRAAPCRGEASRGATDVAPSQPLPPAPSADSIETLLNWGLSIMGATGAFTVDPQGFVIATAGVTPSDYFESTGASLSFAVEQLGLVDSNSEPLLWVELGYLDSALLAFPGSEPRIKDYLMVFVETESLPRDHLKTLAFELSHRLSELT
jgi:hypothetical protein